MFLFLRMQFRLKFVLSCLIILSTSIFLVTTILLSRFLSLRKDNLKYPNPYILRYSKFCIYYNFLQAEKLNLLTEKELETTITLAVHSTLNYAHQIYDQALSWNHLISLAIFIRPGEEVAVQHLARFWHCFLTIRSKVSVHLVWRMAPFQRFCHSELALSYFETKCENISSNLPITNSLNLPELQYPINYLRNVARLGARSRVHIVADVENVFSEEFANLVQNFMRELITDPDEKLIYIFRRFEIEGDEREPPKTIAQLFELFNNGKAFEFHEKLFALGHVIPDVLKWFNNSINSSKLIATEFKYRNTNFEPQFLMRKDAPLHYEDVPARFYDHQLLVNELCRAGYKFRILSHVFNVHMGVKRELNEVESLVNKLAMKESKVRRKFNEYLDKKYGSDWPPIKCPPF